MIAIKVENARQSILYGVALVSIFALIAGVSYVYWMHPSGSMAPSSDGALSQAVSPSPEGGARESDRGTPDESSTLWFYGTLVVCLILVFGLTFRYYSHREMKEAERRWKMSCENFLTRVEMERLASEEEQARNYRAWWNGMRGVSAGGPSIKKNQDDLNLKRGSSDLGVSRG